MNVKRYIAKSAPEAMDAIRRDLGRDAVILSQRTFRKKGLTGLFQKPLVEVTAAYGVPEPEAPAAPAAGEALQEEAERRDEIARMARQLDDLKEIVLASRQVEKPSEQPAPETDPLRERALRTLREHDLDEKVAAELVARAWEEAGETQANPVRKLRELIVQRIGVHRIVELSREKRHVILLAGPTGNGKTTTLVKLAGLCLCRPDVKVGLINTDTYRIGAYDQIRIYSDILEIPMRTANTVEELKSALDAQADRDVILVDTAGKNSWDRGYQENLKGMIEAANPDDILLVISVNTSRRAVQEIIANYSFIGDFKLIISKMDEVKAWGNVLNIMCAAKRPLAYVTTGQSVPDDIELPDIDKLLARILPEDERL
jgi:flagellar biosynthesis protein FlhF